MINQYANSPRINGILDKFADCIDPSARIDAFYNVVWNINTAQGFGLDIWGRIVGASRYLQVPTTVNYFGFQDFAGDYYPFNQQTFYSGPLKTSTYTLSDDAFRVLILAKALTNIVRATNPGINQVLQQLFPSRGACYVNDLGNMQIRYTFRFALQPWEFAILQTAGALPRPTGVKAFIAQIPQGSTFGFQEAGDASPFGYGTFLSTGAIANAA